MDGVKREWRFGRHQSAQHMVVYLCIWQVPAAVLSKQGLLSSCMLTKYTEQPATVNNQLL
jgi:hypothetical protein